MGISDDSNDKRFLLAEAFRRRSVFQSALGRWALTDWALFYVPPGPGLKNYSVLRWDALEKISVGPGLSYATAYGPGGVTVPLPEGDLPFMNRLFDLLEKHGIREEPFSLRMMNRKRLKSAVTTAGENGALWSARLRMIPAYLVLLFVAVLIVVFFWHETWGFGRSVFRGVSTLLFAVGCCGWLCSRCLNFYWTKIDGEYRRLFIEFRSRPPEERNRIYAEIKAGVRGKAESRQERYTRLLEALRFTPREIDPGLRPSPVSSIRNAVLILYLMSAFLLIPYLLTGRDACRALLPFCWTDAGTGTVIRLVPREGRDAKKMTMLEIERLDENGQTVTFTDRRRFPKKRYESGRTVNVRRFRDTDLYQVFDVNPILDTIVMFTIFSVPILIVACFLIPEIRREHRVGPMLENGEAAIGLVMAGGINRCDVILKDDVGFEGPTIAVYGDNPGIGSQVLVVYSAEEMALSEHSFDPKRRPIIGHVIDPPTLSVMYDEGRHQFREIRRPLLETVVYTVLVVETVLWGLVIRSLL